MFRKLIYFLSYVSVLGPVGNAVSQPGTGLRGQYYQWSGGAPPPRSAAFANLVLTRIDPTINFDWGTDSPDPSISADQFAARWEGQIETQNSETYTFYTITDDGIRLWVGNQLIIQNWTNHGATEDSGTISMTAGVRYDIRMEWYEDGGDAQAELYWESASTTRQVVPQGVLYPYSPSWFKAHDPDPPDGAENVTSPLLQWTAGDTAAMHDVYLGMNPVLGPADFQGRQTAKAYYHVAGLTPGTTYYWRVDEVEADGLTIHTGHVWSFTAPTFTAWNPDPPEGARFVDPNAQLSWSAGWGAVMYHLYVSPNLDAVTNGTAEADRGIVAQTSYAARGLGLDATYYWRVDAFDGAAWYTGEVWSFSTETMPITDPDLIGWWKLDGLGAETTALDWSGYYHHGTVMGDPQWVIGYDGDALELDGDGDYVDVGSVGISGIDTRTIAGWAKASTKAVPSWTTVFGFAHDGDGDGTYFDIEVDNAGNYVVHVSGWQAVICTVDTRWHHFAATYDGSTGSWYLDGQLIGSQAGPIATIDQVRIGARLSYPNYFCGLVDDVRVYNKPLAQSKIREIMRGDPKLACGPSPRNGSTVDTIGAASLSWLPGDTAASHDVYFGIDKDAVADANRSSPECKVRQPGTTYPLTGFIQFGGGIYYWRIDEVEADNTTTHKGRVWCFTVADYLIVDDFEDYNDYSPDRIFQTWIDGLGYTEPSPGRAGNGTGSTVGYPEAPFAEQTIVHDGEQSMPFGYDNSGTGGKARYSETQCEWATPQDWTSRDVKALTLWFCGDPGNAAEQLYVAVEDSIGKTKVVNHNDPTAVLLGNWQEWNIDLKEFSGAGVNLESIKRMYLGVGNRDNPQAGGTGTVYFDDIRLYKPRCIAWLLKPAADLSDNCVVDYADLQIMASEWLSGADGLTTDLNADDDVDLADYAILADAWLGELLWPQP